MARKIGPATVLVFNGSAYVEGSVLSLSTADLRRAVAVGVTGAVGWHGVALLGQLRRALPARFGATVRYYVVAAAFLVIGGALGRKLGERSRYGPV